MCGCKTDGESLQTGLSAGGEWPIPLDGKTWKKRDNRKQGEEVQLEENGNVVCYRARGRQV